jgi:hypothetical protein
MQIIELCLPINGGSLYFGSAISKSGRRYSFFSERGEARSVFREDPKSTLSDGRTYWHRITAPKALSIVVRKAVRQAIKSGEAVRP